jgi:hypothetical protein
MSRRDRNRDARSTLAKNGQNRPVPSISAASRFEK